MPVHIWVTWVTWLNRQISRSGLNFVSRLIRYRRRHNSRDPACLLIVTISPVPKRAVKTSCQRGVSEKFRRWSWVRTSGRDLRCRLTVNCTAQIATGVRRRVSDVTLFDQLCPGKETKAGICPSLSSVKSDLIRFEVYFTFHLTLCFSLVCCVRSWQIVSLKLRTVKDYYANSCTRYKLNKFMLCLWTLNVFSSLAFAITFTFLCYIMVISYNVITH